ncbi:uncharacterized protein LOC130653659 [Hydractinia symbiolongicarpus]|uniref:uncharacterized protein LOC130653659 n=1 Tax=Hydractinia symbiolongicarpus TaxID=13093 RepID=UPI00254E5BA8|nr:uncharacterized protein LOC130653659 [Hydractinia symbiolongicarpus]
MFQIDLGDLEFVLSKTFDLISPNERVGWARPIEADEQLALTLRCLTTDESFKLLSFQYRILMNAVSYIVKGCCKAVVKKFKERWNFPHGLGAIDGKHVRIQTPNNSGSIYYNYKYTHSIFWMATAGPSYECLFVDVGSNGRVNHSGIWNRTVLLQGIQYETVELPADAKLSNGESAPYVYLGYDAFALKKFMTKDFPQQGLN